MKNSIGIFDSGVGGLTVLQAMKEYFPHSDLIYIGDNKNCPYGDKTKEELYQCASKVIEYFIERQVSLVVLACNTTSANILEDLREHYPGVDMIGVIDSTVQSFLKQGKKHVLVMATQATIQSNKYASLIHSYNKEIEVMSLATPQLVPLIESGAYKQGIVPVLNELLEGYRGKIDSLILGCTHYPIIVDQIKQVLGEITYLSSSASVSKEVAFYCKEHHLIDSQAVGQVEIYTTGSVEEFKNACLQFYSGDETIQFLDL